MLPILYSFRRCPYAIRARLAIQYSGCGVELREVALRDMPANLMEASPKGTVPVLLLPDRVVIDESWDIMLWALEQYDPDAWLGENNCHLNEARQLVEMNDLSFKPYLDRYKYADRYPEHPAVYYRSQAEAYIELLEQRLVNTRYLLSNQETVADIAIFPFIRQFALVDKHWFDQTHYRCLQRWLTHFLESDLFASIMHKYPIWQPGHKRVLFAVAR